jgi:flagellar basal body P-ring protein FlgI
MRAWCKQIFHAAGAVVLAASVITGSIGCDTAPPKVTPKYADLPEREVPDYLKGTIFQVADLTGTEPFPVSGYGLVTHLAGTGGCRVATPIREDMSKELSRHEFGELSSPLPSPDAVLDDPNVTIVKIEGEIPPGARCGTGWATWFDVKCSILNDSDATSLAHGVLFRADLKVNGANPSDPGNGTVDVKAQAAGPIFVNPSYVLDTNLDTPAARDGVHSGVVMAGARVMADRPLILRLRIPDRRVARAVETRINQRFQDVVDDDLRPVEAVSAASAKKVANAQDEGVILVYVPRIYSNHWKHFAKLIECLYLQGGNPQFAADRAQKLAKAALEPKAPLLEISYCWEGLGRPALFALTPLMSDRRPDVQYAAVRAAAFIGDPAAVPTLLSIATAPGNPHRVEAVETLGELPDSPRINRLCRMLLDSDEADVRIAAYNLLSAHGDSSVDTRKVENGMQEVFTLDMIRSDQRGIGTPMIYATRQGVPHLAVFGERLLVDQPLLFTAFDDKLTISSSGDGKVKIFYRGPDVKKPVSVECGPNIDQIVDELAGDGKIGPNYLHFGYSEICAVVQKMVDQHLISGPVAGGTMLASYVPQPSGELLNLPAEGRSPLRENHRPQSEHPELQPASEPGSHLLRGGAAAADGPVGPPLASSTPR